MVKWHSGFKYVNPTGLDLYFFIQYDMLYILVHVLGMVYKVNLSNKQCVAIKHIINDVYNETFAREVTSLLHIRHRNLVTLLGYCEEKDERFLIYELCPNGNLFEWLFGILLRYCSLLLCFLLICYYCLCYLFYIFLLLHACCTTTIIY